MKSKKSILISACSMALVLSNAATVYATDDSRTVVNIRADLSNPNYSQKVEKIFEDPDVLTVNVIDTSLQSDISKKDLVMETSSTTTRYEATGKKKAAGNYTGSKVLAQAKGGPGMTLQISHTKSVSHSYSCSVPVTLLSVKNVVGFSVTDSVSITVSGSATVPSVHNNKKVKAMTLTVHPYYLKYTYSVVKITNSCGLVHRTNAGTGSASKATGCSFTRAYTYK